MSAQPPAPWTGAQWEAITRTGADLLVAAAAGSGKTAVLVERIIRKITAGPDPVDVDRLLVVTFTDAAADEMRRRIRDALQRRLDETPADERLRRQLALLPRAPISTLHGFCHRVLREYFYRAGLDPKFRLADEHETLMLQHDALDAVLADAYRTAQPGDGFSRLASATAGPEGDAELRRLVLELYEQARSLPDPIGWLRRLPTLPWGEDPSESADRLLDQAPWQWDLRRWIRLQVASARALLQQARQWAAGPGGVARYIPALEEQLEQVAALQAALDLPFSALRAAFLAFALPGLPRARPGEGDPAVRQRVQDLRRSAQERIVAVRDLVFAPPPQVHVDEIRRAVPYIRALVDLTLAFHREYTRLKEARSLLDFADLEHRCLALLSEDADAPAPSPSPVARELRARFVEVLVDEYQDTNPVQEAILRHIAPSGRPGSPGGAEEEGGPFPTLFAVGDVKQSIYRFRLADPTLFLERYARSRPLPPGDPAEWLQAVEGLQGIRIDLNANFRSRRGVVDAVNYVFRSVMVPDVGEMAYDDAAALVCAARYPDEEGAGETPAGDPPVEFHLLERRGDDEPGDEDDPDGAGEEDPEDLTAFEQEALIAAQRIRELAGLEGQPPMQVWDAAAGAYRPLRLGDVAVLLRATRTKANALVDIFGRLGIPAYADLGTGYFAATEVETMLALLAVIDNPRQDIPLAAVLRSPLVNVSDADLARIRLLGGRQGGPGRFYDAVRAAAGMGDSGDGDGPPLGGKELDGKEGDLARRLRAFLEQLDRWRTVARRGPLGDLIQDIYRTTRYDQYVAALPGGRQRQANLRTLYARARQFDSFHRQGLSRFLRFIRRLQETAGDLGAAPAAPEDDRAVRVMSVHRSKGLEFPVVILMDVGREFTSPRGEAGLFLFHRAQGAAMMAVDEERWSAHPSLPYLALQERIRQEDLAEEMRILYVALTRARERLILIGSVSGVPRACSAWLQTVRSANPEGPLPAEPLAQAKSWLDWLGPALCRHRSGQPLRDAAAQHRGSPPPSEGNGPALPLTADPSSWRVILWTAGSLPPLDAEREVNPPPIPWERLAAGEPLSTAAAPRLPRDLEERLAWRYPARALSGKAAKVSISELKRHWERDNEESLPLAGQLAAPFQRRFQRQREGAAPLTAAERGTAVHMVLQLLDLAGPLDRDGIARQVERLQAEGRLSPQQAAAVDCGILAAFFASPLGRRLQQAGTALMREVPFSLALPAREVYPDLSGPEVDGEYVLTQGIIDVMAPLDEGIVLVDFKTDRVAPGAVQDAARRYRTQMALYERAVREIFGRPPAEVYIVFLSSGEAVRIR